MTDALTKFLVDLAVDPDLQAKYAADPEGVMSRAGLSDPERAAMLTRDATRIRAAMGHGPAHHMTQQKTKKKKAAKSSKKKAAKKGRKKS